MAKLDKLRISGIRNFSPHEFHDMKFSSPLTLILGENGCGKTTIIEAIKYACCEEVPPGTGKSGPGFINDPKLTEHQQVKGQVRLRIIDQEGNEVTIVRSRTVIQQPDGTFPKLGEKDQTIRHEKTINNEKIDTSGRCVDITQYCCQVLNVTQSILSNVIFCHQENSLWPLEEGKTVKEKFDQIFDSDRYNKCVDLVLDSIKKKKQSLKILKVEVDNAQTLKLNVENKRHQLDEKQEKLQGFNDEIEDKLKQQQPIVERLKKIYELEGKLNDLEKQITTKETERKGLYDQKNAIVGNAKFEEFEGDDDELDKTIKTSKDDKIKLINNTEMLEIKKNEITDEMEKHASKLEKSINEIGQLKQEKDQFERKRDERKKLFEQAESEFDLKLNQYNFNKDSTIIVKNLDGKLKKFQQNLKDFSNEKETEQNDLQKELDEIRERSIKTEQQIKTKQDNIEDNRKKINQIDKTLKRISINQGELVKIRQRLEDIDKNIENLNKTFSEDEQNREMNNKKIEIVDKENRLEEYENQLKILQQNDVNNGKIDVEQQSICERLLQIDEIKSNNMEILEFLFDDQIPDNNLQQNVGNLQKRNDLIVKNLTNHINQHQQEITVLETRKSNKLQLIQATQEDLERKEQTIEQTCERSKIEDLLNDAIIKREQLQKDKGYYSSGKITYERYIDEFKKKLRPNCPVCMTQFDKNKQQHLIAKILRNLESEITKFPEGLNKTEKELQRQNDLCDKLHQLKMVNDDVEIIKNRTLPQLNGELQEIEDELKKKTKQFDQLKSDLIKPQKIFNYCSQIISDCTKIDQYQQFIQQSDCNIKRLQQQLKQLDSNKTKHELETEIYSIKNEIQKNRQIIDNITKNINNHKDRLHRLSNERQDYMQKQLDFEQLLRDQPNLEKDRTELIQTNRRLDDEIQQLKIEFDAIRIELGNFEKKRNDIIRNNKNLIDTKRNKCTHLKQLFDRIQMTQNEIVKYEAKAIDDQLNKCQDQVDKLKKKDKDLNQVKDELIGLISAAKEEIANYDIKFRNLQDNRMLRDKQQQIQQLDRDIDELKRKSEGYNHRSLMNEKERLLKKNESFTKEINTVRGQCDELLVTINDIKVELNLPHNKNAYKNYMSKLYEYKITDKSIKDLDKYAKALEKAIIDFHKKRMEEINNTIREYWRNIYRGNDIECIAIKSDYVKSNNRRIYNYRVVQVKDDVEIDMRGRSSAGQKVLACLIIRLAIAETLASRCGILALDEPTTNLDEYNIESLSATLSRIVEYRQKERNFQLIIITHDEEFLRTITRSHHVPYFYRITRGPKGFSQIQKEHSL